MTDEAFTAARRHAIAEYPNESCGLVIGGVYHPCTNVHPTPTTHFRIDSRERLALEEHGEIEMIIHSHPDGLMCPSAADMEGQIESGVPWGVMAVVADQASDITVWGADTPIAPLIGRPFIHGVHDCYDAIRDTFALGKTKLAEQGITDTWPFDPIVLPNFARDDGWWTTGGDLYRENFEKAGFREIGRADARAGDVFLVRLNSEIPNHGGVLVADDQLFHHLPLRVSRREGAGIWARAADVWLRYVGQEATDAS